MENVDFQVTMNAVKRPSFPNCEGLRSRRKVLHWSLCMSLSKTNMETVRLVTSAKYIHMFCYIDSFTSLVIVLQFINILY